MSDRQALYSENDSEPQAGRSVSPVIRRLRVRSPSGAQNRFLSIGLDNHSSLLRYIQALTFLDQKNKKPKKLQDGFCLFVKRPKLRWQSPNLKRKFSDITMEINAGEAVSC